MHLKKKFGNEMVYFQMSIKNTQEAKSDDNSIIIEGYASTKDLDRHNDVVVPKAFESSLKGYLKNNPILLLGHDDEKAIGTVKKANIDKKGLYITAEVKNNIDEIFDRIKNGTTKTFSIGFIPKAWQFILNGKVIADESGIKEGYSFDDLINKDTYRKITNLELVEISVVNVPANGNATFAFKKSLELNKQFIMEKGFTSFNKEEQDRTDEMLKNIEEEEKIEEEVEEVEKEEILDENEEEETKEEEKEEEREQEQEEPAEDSEQNSKNEDKKTEMIDTSSEKDNEAEIAPKGDEKQEEIENEEEEKEDDQEGSNNDEIEEKVEEEKEEEKKIGIIVEKLFKKIKEEKFLGDGNEIAGETPDTEGNKSEIEAQKKHIQSLEGKIEELETLVKSIPMNKGMVYVDDQKHEVKDEYNSKGFQSFSK